MLLWIYKESGLVGDLIYAALDILSVTCESGLVSYFAFHLYEAAEERMGVWVDS